MDDFLKKQKQSYKTLKNPPVSCESSSGAPKSVPEGTSIRYGNLCRVVV